MSSVSAKESVTQTGSPVYRLKHQLIIKDFASTYLAHSTDKTSYLQLNSAWFSSSLDSQVEFRINLRPKGRDEKSQDYLGLYLEMKRSRPSLLAKAADVKYKFSLFNERKEECHSQEIRREFAFPSGNWGWFNFLKHSQLQDPANGLLPGDQLTILAEIDVFPEPVIKQGNELPLAKLKVASIENVKTSLADLLDSGDHSDVVLVVDGEKLPAHKTLLSAHSPVFSARFKSKVAEVKIRNMKLAVAKKLLRYIYTGEIEDELEEYAEELIMAADKYGINRLKALCSQFLCGQLDTENAAYLLAFADRHSVAQLKSTCVEYIRAHWEDVCLTEQWNLYAQKVFLKELRLLKENEKEEKGETSQTPEDTSLAPTPSIVTEESSTVNGSLKYHLKYDWTVNGFASTYLTDRTTYPQLFSAWFSSPLDSQVEFRISLYPRGSNEKFKNNISLYLEMKRNDPSPLAKSADVKFKFSLLNGRKEECHSREYSREFGYPSTSWGFPTFLEHSKLQDPANGLLPGDTLTILVELDVFPEPVIKHCNASLLAKLKLASIENVRGSLAGILKSGAHSDVVLEVDNTELTAHKAILSLHSPVFNAMFKSEMSEQKEGTVKIPDLKVEVAQAMLRFIYTGEVEDDLAEYGEELLVAADKYDVARLMNLCSQYLCGQLNTENAARLLALADRHSVAQLKSVAFDYIHAHWDDLLLTDDWLLVHGLFTSELRLFKQGQKRKTPEELESAN